MAGSILGRTSDPIPLLPSGRADVLSIKIKLANLLPKQQGRLYWNRLADLVSGKISRAEWEDGVVKGVLGSVPGGEQKRQQIVRLHNLLLKSILHNLLPSVAPAPSSYSHKTFEPSRKRKYDTLQLDLIDILDDENVDPDVEFQLEADGMAASITRTETTRKRMKMNEGRKVVMGLSRKTREKLKEFSKEKNALDKSDSEALQKDRRELMKKMKVTKKDKTKEPRGKDKDRLSKADNKEGSEPVDGEKPPRLELDAPPASVNLDLERVERAPLCVDLRDYMPPANVLKDRLDYVAYKNSLEKGCHPSVVELLELAIHQQIKDVLTKLIDTKTMNRHSLLDSSSFSHPSLSHRSPNDPSDNLEDTSGTSRPADVKDLAAMVELAPHMLVRPEISAVERFFVESAVRDSDEEREDDYYRNEDSEDEEPPFPYLPPKCPANTISFKQSSDYKQFYTGGTRYKLHKFRRRLDLPLAKPLSNMPV